MRRIIIAILLMFGITILPVDAQADPTSSDCLPNRDIVFASDASGSYYGLYQLRIPDNPTDLPEIQPLLSGVPELSQGMVDVAPRWSPDGKLIAFMSSRQENFDIFLGWQADDAWKLLTLDAQPEDQVLPDWSPDSETLAYTMTYDDNNEEIMMIGLRSGDSVRLTDNPARDFYPSWSPDGQWIVFVSDRDGSADLFVLNPADLSVTNLTPNETAEYAPDWSPDGRSIAFESDASGNVQIWTMNVETGEFHQITDEPGILSSPQWSPDGHYLLAMGRSTPEADWDLYLITVATGEVRLLLDNTTNDMSPTWRFCMETVPSQ